MVSRYTLIDGLPGNGVETKSHLNISDVSKETKEVQVVLEAYTQFLEQKQPQFNQTSIIEIYNRHRSFQGNWNPSKIWDVVFKNSVRVIQTIKSKRGKPC